jgi:hypothetical protein
MEGLEPEMEPEPLDEMGGDPQPTGLENEFKTVPGVHAPEAPDPVSEPIAQPMPEPMGEPQPQQEPDDNVFFGDAPEQRTKNPRYN